MCIRDRELVELLVGLAGKPGDEGRAHGGARERDAYAREKVEISGAVAAALHAPQDGAGGVLEGDVHVRHRVAREGLKEGLINTVGLQVERAQPDGGGLERLELGEQPLEPAPARLRPPRGVLADEHELFGAGGQRGAGACLLYTSPSPRD